MKCMSFKLLEGNNPFGAFQIVCELVFCRINTTMTATYI